MNRCRPTFRLGLTPQLFSRLLADCDEAIRERQAAEIAKFARSSADFEHS
jgi:hypothetical protein